MISLAYRMMAVKQIEMVTGKTLDRQLREPYIPAADHACRQYSRRLNRKPIEEAVRHGTDRKHTGICVYRFVD